MYTLVKAGMMPGFVNNRGLVEAPSVSWKVVGPRGDLKKAGVGTSS